MTITQIECFVETARMGSLSKAAENLFISQPAVSRQIRALENDLGFPLFERKNTGVNLTQMGEILYDNWKEMLLIHRSAVDKAKDLYYGEQKTIRIGILESLSEKEHITDALIRFNQKYPDLDVEYDVFKMRDLKNGIEQGKLHMIITYISELWKDHVLHTHYLDEFMMRAGLICARNQVFFKGKHPEITDIRGQTVGILSKEASLDHKERVTNLLAKNQLAGQVKLKEYNSWHNLQMALVTGKCVTVMYEGIRKGFEDRLAFYPLELEDYNSKVVIAWQEDRYAIKVKNIAQIY